MVKIIMHGCNGHMGQVISGLVEKDPDAEIVAGIDVADQGKNSYPVYTNMEECQVEADALIDFSSAKATDALLAYCEKRHLPVVLCTTGLSEEQLAKVEETARNVAVLKSANMSLGINTLMKLLQDAAKVLATAGFDIEVVEKHHRLKLDAPSGTALALADTLALAVLPLRLKLLDVGRVPQHDAAQLHGWVGGIDPAPEPVAGQQRQKAGVVDVVMGRQHTVDLAGGHGS